MLAANVGSAVRAIGAEVGASQAVVAWASSRGVFATVAGSGGMFGAPRRLSGIGVGNDAAQVLAADPRGDALVLWQRPYHDNPSRGPAGSLFAAYRPAGRGFGVARRLARNALSAGAALDGRGNALIAWDQLSGPDRRGTRATIDVVERDADGRYGPVRPIASGTVDLSGLAVDPAGQAVVVWESGALPAGGIQAATREPGGQFGTPVVISPASLGGQAGGVGMDDTGRALIAWDGPYDGAAAGLPYGHVQVTALSVGAAAPGVTQTLLTPTLGRLDSAPKINVDGAGDAVVTWQNTTRDGRGEKIVAARATHGRLFAAPSVLGTSYFGGGFDAAIGPDGRAAVAWDSLTAPVRAVYAASPRGPFGRAARLAAASDSAEPVVALGPHGRGLAIWWELSTPRYLRYARTG